MFDAFTTPEAWISLLTLTAMEIVLGIDNVIFIAILCGKLPEHERDKVRRLGLSLALVMRLGLLFALSWLMRLTEPLFSLFDHPFSGRDLILIGGGLFLVAKATYEIHHKLEVHHEESAAAKGTSKAGMILAQILILDIVFSLDSVITAVGMAQALSIMVIAMVVAVAVMLIFSGGIGRFVDRHPTMKILALSFLVLIGVMLVVEGMGQHVSKGYIYFAMAFSLLVEVVNMQLRKRQSQPVTLHSRFEDEAKAKKS